MASSFLNKAALRTVFRILYCILCCGTAIADIVGLTDLQAESTEAARIMLNRETCEDRLAQYYRTGETDLQSLFESFDSVRAALCAMYATAQGQTEHNIELLLCYLEYAKIFSTVYNYSGDRQCKKYLKTIDDEAAGFIKRTVQKNSRPAAQKENTVPHRITAAQKSELFLRYADYLYTKLILPEQVFNIAAALPVLYRRALMLNPDNTEASVKLACWHIFPADETTAQYNSFIESREEYLELLSPADQFNAYLLYSTYYMKKYDSQKGRSYLQKAAALFPDHVLLSHLYENYEKGLFTL